MLIQVLRIFVPRGSQSKTYYVVHGLIWMNSVYYVIIVFLMIFNCRPIHKGWNPWVPGKCMEIGIIAMCTAIVNLIGDLSILFLTQKVIWNLMRVERRQRLKLSVVFFAGIMYVLSLFRPCISPFARFVWKPNSAQSLRLRNHVPLL